MKIPPFWSKVKYEHVAQNGKKYWFFANGWSFESLSSAKEDALKRAKRNMQIFFSGEQRARGGYYLDRPIREEIIDELIIAGEQVAVITRNGYGAAVLNAAKTMFVDIDFTQKPKKPTGFLAALFGRNSSEESNEEEQLDNVAQWANLNPNHSFRLYKTAAGLRLLFTGKTYDPASDEVKIIMQSLAADPLYMQLCKSQECFRARLTPKPWRINYWTPPNKFPFLRPQYEEQNRKWEKKYAEKIEKYQTAKFIQEFGQPDYTQQAKAIVAYHDELCRVNDKKPLA